MAKIWENRASLSNHNISYILLASYLFLVWSYSFKLYAIHQQFWKYLKVQKIMDQHIFEMIHFKCTTVQIFSGKSGVRNVGFRFRKRDWRGLVIL